MFVKALVPILKSFAKKNPDDIFPAIAALKKKFGNEIYKNSDPTKKLKNTISRAWQSKEVGGNPMKNVFTGLMGGEKIVDPATGKLIRGFSEKTRDKLSTAQKDQIKKAFEKGYSDNPTIQNIIDFANIGGESQSLSTYAKLQQNFAKQFKKGDLRKLRKNKDLYADFNEAFNLRRFEAQLMKNGLLDELTPADQLLTKYGRQGWENVLDKRKGLTSLVMDESKIGKYLLDQGYDRNQIIASIGHDYPLMEFASLLGGKGKPNMSPFRAARLVNRPENIRSELGFMNQAKSRGIEPFLYEKPLWTADDMGIMNKIMSDAQLTSKFYGPGGIRQQLGTGQQIDPKQLLQYLRYIHKDQPFGSAKFPRTLPTRKDILKLLQGDIKYNFKSGGVVDSFMGGGIANLGIKMLQKLAKKMPEEDFLKLTETLWSGVDPKKSGRYRAWAKNRWSPGYRWPYERSRVSGRDIEKSHFASLSPAAKEALKKRYRERIDKYIKRKREEEWS
jgi:hypothetical protein